MLCNLHYHFITNSQKYVTYVDWYLINMPIDYTEIVVFNTIWHLTSVK